MRKRREAKHIALACCLKNYEKDELTLSFDEYQKITPLPVRHGFGRG